MEISMQNHYETHELTNWEQLNELFPDGEANELNWCFVGTSGVHGTYSKLDQYPEITTFTIIVVQPRTVTMYYGELDIEDESQFHYLRELVNTTLMAVNESQSVNVGPHELDE